MSSFNESAVRRGPGGKFAEKPAASEAGGVVLAEPAGGEPVEVSDLVAGHRVYEHGETRTVLSVDNDHRSTSVEYADGVESYRNSESVEVVNALQVALDKDRDPRARFDETGPGGWGSYESEVTLGHETTVTDTTGTRRTAPAGTRATLRTDLYADAADSDAPGMSTDRLRFGTYLEVGGAEYRPEDASQMTNISEESSDDERRAALEKVHTAMRYASRHGSGDSYSAVAERMSWIGTNPSIVIDHRLPETGEPR